MAWFCGGLETVLVVLSWFVLNIAMGSSTKWIFLYGEICVEGLPRDCRAFKYPLMITVIHMVFSWGMCWVQLYRIRGRPKGSGLSIAQQLEKVAPLSVCFSLSVAMGNLSLKYIFPSFNQMLGSMSPLITVIMAMLMERKRYNSWTWVSMPIICGGLALCSCKEVNFHPLGALYAMGATILRALKSIMQGKLLKGDRMDSVTLLFYMAPWAAVLLLVLAIATEGVEPQLLLLYGLRGTGAPGPDGQPAPTVTGGVNVLVLLVVSGMNACLLNVANFMVTSYTSAVTLQVLGNVKSCLSIAVSVAIFRNSLTLEQGVGVFTCLLGVGVYNQKGGPASTVDRKATPKSPKAADAKPILDKAVRLEEAEPQGQNQVELGARDAGLAARPTAAATAAASTSLPEKAPGAAAFVPRSP